MPIKLSFERQTLSFHTDVITIGRDPVSQVAFPNDSRVALHHAVLKCINGRWLAESKEGGPFRVGNGRSSGFAWLNPGDVIYLTESGPELIFDPSSDGGSPPASNSPSVKFPQNSSIPATALSRPVTPYPSANADAERPNSNKDRLFAHLGPHTPQPIENESVITGSDAVPRKSSFAPIAFLAASATLIVVVISGFSFISHGSRSPKLEPLPSETAAQNVSEDTFVPVPPLNQRGPSDHIIDPREFLVLIGFGDLTSGDRPIVLGVGWLWNDRTVVTSRSIGTAIEMVTQAEGSTQQGCVIYGRVKQVSKVIQPAGCKEISILELESAVNQSKAAGDQWLKVNTVGIETQRSSGKRFDYFSFDPLPRPADIPESYDLPMCEYDPETCRLNSEAIRLEYKSHEHFLGSTKLVRGGLIVDEDHKIVGMVPLYSPIIWTETLERALNAR